MGVCSTPQNKYSHQECQQGTDCAEPSHGSWGAGGRAAPPQTPGTLATAGSQAGRASGEVLLLGWIVESCVGGREGLEFPRPSNPRSLPQLWCLHAWAGRRPTRWGFLGGRFQHPWVTQLRSPSEVSRVAWLSRWRSGSPLKGSHAVSFFWVASLADIVINALEWGLTQGSNSELAKGSRMSLN